MDHTRGGRQPVIDAPLWNGMESNDDYYTATDQTNQPASQPLSLSSVCPRTVVTRNLSNLFLRLLPQQGQRQQQQHYRCYCCRSCSRYVESMSSSSAKPISFVCMCGWLAVCSLLASSPKDWLGWLTATE